jgi:hypothetical protein
MDDEALERWQREHRQREVFKTKLIQVLVTVGAVISLLLGYVTKEEWFAVPTTLCLVGSLFAFQARTYMPTDELWKRYQKFMAYILALVLIVSLFVFPSDPDCYVDWDGRSNPTVCK